MSATEREVDAGLVKAWFTTAVDTLHQIANPSMVHSMDPLRTRAAVASLLTDEAVTRVSEALVRLAVAPNEAGVVVGEAEYVHAAGLLLAQMEAAQPAGDFLAGRTTKVIRALIDGSAKAFAPQEPTA